MDSRLVIASQNKYFKIFLVILSIAIYTLLITIVCSVLSNSKQLISTDETRKNQKETTTELTPISKNDSSLKEPSDQNERRQIITWSARPAVLPDNILALQMLAKENGDGSFLLNFSLHFFTLFLRPIIMLDGVELKDTAIAHIIVDKEEFKNIYFNFPDSYVSYPTTGNKFALRLRNKIYIYKYELEQNLSITNFSYDTSIQPKIILTTLQEIETADCGSILFSGDGTQLFCKTVWPNLGVVKMLIPEEKIIECRGENYDSPIYQIPDSPGFTYWLPSQNPLLNLLVVDFGTNFQIFKILSEVGIDFPGEIKLSPDIRKACLEWQTSGSSGTVLYDLTTEQEIKSGKGCVNWLNNNEVVVYKSNSHSIIKSSTIAHSNVAYYILNLQTDNLRHLYNFTQTISPDYYEWFPYEY